MARFLLPACVILTLGIMGAGQIDAGQPAEEINLAGIVIDYGDGRVAYAVVPFTEDSLSGADLLDHSGLSILAVKFGGLGNAVCMIEEVGCDLSACRARLCQTGDPDSPFWQYVQQSEDGVWETAPLGASSSSVADGDVDGWFWTGDVPDAAPISLEDIADRLDVDLDELRTSESEPLVPMFVTLGETTDDEARFSRWNLLSGSLALGAIVALSAVAIIRSRKLARR